MSLLFYNGTMDKKIDYKIYASGSSGNCVRINNVLFDLGITRKKLDEIVKEDGLPEAVVYTHEHGDHFKEPTFRRALEHGITVYLPSSILLNKIVPAEKKVDMSDVHVVFESEQFEVDDMTLTPHPINHDVAGFGYEIMTSDKTHMIYVTDTHDFNNFGSDVKYDYFFIEANYSQEQLVKRSFANKGYNVVAGAMRHADVNVANAFYFQYRTDENAPLISLHESKRFR